MTNPLLTSPKHKVKRTTVFPNEVKLVLKRVSLMYLSTSHSKYLRECQDQTAVEVLQQVVDADQVCLHFYLDLLLNPFFLGLNVHLLILKIY